MATIELYDTLTAGRIPLQRAETYQIPAYYVGRATDAEWYISDSCDELNAQHDVNLESVGIKALTRHESDPGEVVQYEASSILHTVNGLVLATTLVRIKNARELKLHVALLGETHAHEFSDEDALGVFPIRDKFYEDVIYPVALLGKIHRSFRTGN
ncbi:MAG TPA: hypothetical protein VLE69_02115 [Candidatus Saccharimonadales bacterium]|nr:hypothetical protein [Candidatus Saccharimonadales bacterium]